MTSIAEKHIPIVHNVVRAYLRRHPNLGYLKDDLISAGYVRLVEAVNDAETSSPDNFEGYLAGSVGYAVKAHAAENVNSVNVSSRTRHRRRVNGDEIEECTVNRVPLESLSASDEGTEQVDLLDAIFAACSDDFERRIVELRMENHTLAEIGKKLECHDSTVSYRLKKIYARYKEITS